jgi:hypothetical protein
MTSDNVQDLAGTRCPPNAEQYNVPVAMGTDGLGPDFFTARLIGCGMAFLDNWVVTEATFAVVDKDTGEVLV